MLSAACPFMSIAMYNSYVHAIAIYITTTCMAHKSNKAVSVPKQLAQVDTQAGYPRQLARRYPYIRITTYTMP